MTRINWSTLTQQQMRELAYWWPNVSQGRQQAVARAFGMSENYIDRQLVWVRNYESRQGNEAQTALDSRPTPSCQRRKPEESPPPVMPAPLLVAPLPVPNYDNVIDITGDNVVLTSDWHDPYRNWQLWLASIYVARAIGASHYFILGDLMDNGQQGISPWDGNWPVVTPTADRVFDQLVRSIRVVRQRTGAHVVITGGNHDVWLDKTTGGQLWLNRLLTGAADGITVSRYHYCYLTTSRGKWLLIHPKNYSQIILRVPATHRDRTGLNVACGHTHGLGLGVRNGRYIAEIGGLFAPISMQYLNQAKSTAPAPTPGFMFLVNGEPHLVRVDQDMHYYLGALYSEYTVALAAMQQRVKRYQPGVSFSQS